MFELFIQGGSFSFNLNGFFDKLWKCYKYGNYMYEPKIRCL